MNLSKNVKATLVKTSVAAAQNAITSDSVDMSGFEGVMFLMIIGTVSAGGVLTAKAQVSDDNVTFADPTSGAISAVASASNKFLLLDVYRPQHRYVDLYATIATANVAVGGIIAIQYGPRNKPTIQDAATLAAQVLSVDPS